MSEKATKRHDILIIGIALAVSGVLWLVGVVSPKDKSSFVEIYVDNELYTKASLDEEKKITIETNKGINIVEIKDGYAYMIEADCKDRSCIHQGKISLEGETIVCLPHKVVLKAEGEKGLKYDVISG